MRAGSPRLRDVWDSDRAEVGGASSRLRATTMPRTWSGRRRLRGATDRVRPLLGARLSDAHVEPTRLDGGYPS
jgi:hypothetical protein